MRNKITGNRQPIETEGEKKFVQLRLPSKLAEKLETAAKAANRKLPSEIIYRLQGGQDTSADALLYGWVNPDRNKALGYAVGVLAGRIEEVGPMSSDRARDAAGVLAMLKIAISSVLDRLGADDQHLTDDEKSFAALTAREFSNELWRPEPGPNSIGPRPDLEIIAKLAKAWSLKGEGDANA